MISKIDMEESKRYVKNYGEYKNRMVFFADKKDFVINHGFFYIAAPFEYSTQNTDLIFFVKGSSDGKISPFDGIFSDEEELCKNLSPIAINRIFYLRQSRGCTFLGIESSGTSQKAISLDDFLKNPKESIVKISSKRFIFLVTNDSIINNVHRFFSYTILSIYHSILEEKYLYKEMID